MLEEASDAGRGHGAALPQVAVAIAKAGGGRGVLRDVRSLAGAFGCAVAIACGPTTTTPQRHEPVLPARGCGDVGMRCAELAFETPRGRVAVPVVRAQQGAHVVHFVVDTGADTHVLAPEAARRLGLSVREASRAGGASDQLADVDLVLDGGWRVPQRSVVIFDLSHTDLAAMQIDGVLSPQLLASEREDVVVEIEKRRMRLAAPAATDDTAGLSLGTAEACLPTTDFPTRMYRVHGDLGRGDEPRLTSGVALKLDTGRRSTVLFSNVPGVSLVLEPEDRAGGHVPGVLRIGDVTMQGPLPLIERAAFTACRSDGLLGLDVLAPCTIVLGVTGGSVRCPTR